MRHVSCSDDPGAFQLNRRCAQVIEQAHTAAQQNRGEVDLDLVKQPSLDTLLSDTRAGYRDILIAGGLLGLANSAFNAIGDKWDDYLGRTQTRNFDPFVSYFSPRRAKNNQQKKKSTMLPQARDSLWASPIAFLAAPQADHTIHSRPTPCPS
jgi:hypothetical protein